MGSGAFTGPAGFCLGAEDFFTPDPREEDMFTVKEKKFAFSPGQLNKMLNPKSCDAFLALGGMAGLEKGLRTDCKAGLRFDEDDSTLAARKEVFGQNEIPGKRPKAPPKLKWITFNDPVLILLTVAAVISIAAGFRHPSPADPDDWGEGLAILASVVVVVLVGDVADWQEERQFAKINARKEGRVMRVVRSGRTTEISVFDILVGDILVLEPGDVVPVDGVLVSGYNVKCDESSATGESDLMAKTPGDGVVATVETGKYFPRVVWVDPFIISGSRVMEGTGTILVTSVGVHSSYGRVMMSLIEDASSSTDGGKVGPLTTIAVLLSSLGAMLLARYPVSALTFNGIGTAVFDMGPAQWFLQSWSRAVADLADVYSSVDVAGLALMLGCCLITVLDALGATQDVKVPTHANYLRHNLTYIAAVVVLQPLWLLSPGHFVTDPNAPLFWCNLVLQTFSGYTLATIVTDAFWNTSFDLQVNQSNMTSRRIREPFILSTNNSQLCRDEVLGRHVLFIYYRLRALTLRCIRTNGPVADRHKPTSVSHAVLMTSWSLFGLLFPIALISGIVAELPGNGVERHKSLPSQVHWQQLALVLTFLVFYSVTEMVSGGPPERVPPFLLDAPGDPWISLRFPLILLLMGTGFLQDGEGLPPDRALLLPPLELAATVLRLIKRVNLDPWTAPQGLRHEAGDNLVLFIRRVIKATKRRVRPRPHWGFGVPSRDSVGIGIPRVLV